MKHKIRQQLCHRMAQSAFKQPWGEKHQRSIKRLKYWLHCTDPTTHTGMVKRIMRMIDGSFTLPQLDSAEKYSQLWGENEFFTRLIADKRHELSQN